MPTVAFNTIVQAAPIKVLVSGAQGVPGADGADGADGTNGAPGADGVQIVWALTPPADLTVLWGDLNDGSHNSWNGTYWISQGFTSSSIPDLAFLSPSGSAYLSPLGEYYLAPA